MKSNVLIISYVFPPSIEVGGRRWDKFARAIYRNGGSVTILSSDMGIPNTLIGNKPNYIKSHHIIKNKYPEILNTSPTTIPDKIKYRLALKKVKRSTTGNYYDRGIYAKQDFLEGLKGILDQDQIDTVVVTGAPFSLLYFVSLLKDDFNFRLISDIRDPWTFGGSYGIGKIEKSRLLEENRREKLVFEQSDIITLPNESMRYIYQDKYKTNAHKTKVLLHGYDEQEFKNILPNTKKSYIKWVYGGTLYEDCLETYQKLFQYVGNHEFISLDVYGRNSLSINESYMSVAFKDLLNPSAFNTVCCKMDCFIWVFPEKFRNYLSTKLFELIRCRIPIVYIGFEGDFSHFIEKNNLGVFIIENEFLENIDIVEVKLKELCYNSTFPIQDYSIDEIIKAIL